MRLLKEIRNLTGNYHVKSGIYHYYRNEYKQAEEFFRKALKDEDKLADADRNKARHYLTLSLMDSAAKVAETGEADTAIEQLRAASEVSPDFPDIHFRLGRLFEELGRTDEAIAAYRRAIGCGPRYLDARVYLGFCLLRAGRADESATAFGEALELKKSMLDGPFAQAIERLDEGDPARAAELFHDVFLSAPPLAEEYRRKAMEWIKHDEYEKALAEFDRAIELCPKYPDLHNFRGVVLSELERGDEAVEAFRLSAALAPGYLVPRLNLAFAQMRAGDLKEAEAVLEAVLEIDPTEPAALAQLDDLRNGRVPDKRRAVPRGGSR